MSVPSRTFFQAARDLQSWAADLLETPVAFLAAGEPASGAGVALCPWTIDSGLPDRGAEGAGEQAIGHFCLTIGPDAPDAGCKWFDTLYFAALSSPDFPLARSAPPPSFWRGPPGLCLTLSRRILREAELPGTARVREPLVLEVHPNLTRPARERS